MMAKKKEERQGIGKNQCLLVLEMVKNPNFIKIKGGLYLLFRMKKQGECECKYQDICYRNAMYTVHFHTC